MQKRVGVAASEASNRRTPMPKFVIERQYLVPMYQHIVVEAENLEEACRKGISDDIDWDTQEMDSDGSRGTTITSVKLVPDGYDVDPKIELIVTPNEEEPRALDMLSFATFLYENAAETGPLLKIPEQFTDVIKVDGYTCLCGRANRDARDPFTHRRMADPAKTAKKRTALLPRIVRKTSRYPMAENHSQSTRKSLVRPSTMRQATMTIIATAMPLLGISTSLTCSLCSWSGDRVALGAGDGQKRDADGPPRRS
jgi:hypothetical protein